MDLFEVIMLEDLFDNCLNIQGSHLLKFPHVHTLAIDLSKRMLTFDPNQRITVEEALAHPYLENLHDISDEPTYSMPFSFDFEQHTLTEDQMKELMFLLRIVCLLLSILLLDG